MNINMHIIFMTSVKRQLRHCSSQWSSHNCCNSRGGRRCYDCVDSTRPCVHCVQTDARRI